MPRDGSGVYTKPFPDVVTNTTVSSTVYNGFVNDVATDLNTPRPIVAGGTGATSAAGALVNLSAEMAAYAVTNFDTHVWFPGSFRAAAGATSAPVAGHAFAGTVVINEALANPPTNQNVFIEAFDLDDTTVPTPRYVRVKKAGVWSAWVSVAAYATPLDALAYNGLQVNGGCVLDQNWCGIAHAPNQFSLDGWFAGGVGTLPATTQRFAGGPVGMTHFIRMTATGAFTPGASDYMNFHQRLEGLRVLPLNWGTAIAQPLTFGFWVNAARAGLWSGSIVNGAATHAYIFSYTINAPATWEFKTITVPVPPAGTWAKDNTLGMLVMFVLGAGASRLTAPGWVASATFVGATGQINGMQATSDYLAVTGLIMLPGLAVPTSDRVPLIMRNYDQELHLCQRYFEKSYDIETRPGTVNAVGQLTEFNNMRSVGGFAMMTAQYRPKRVLPTVTVLSFAAGSTGNITDGVGDKAATVDWVGQQRARIVCNNSQQSMSAHFVADARV